MRGLCKIFTVLDCILPFLACIMLVAFYLFDIDNSYLIALNLLIIIFSVLKIYMKNKNIYKLKKMNEQIQRVASGNLNGRILVREDGLIGDLACNFNKIIESLQVTCENEIMAEEARRKLMVNISHDIRTPLTSIIGYVDALKDGMASNEEERQEYLQIISMKSRKLKQLIDEIFHMAKLDSDDIKMDFQSHDMGEILRECIIGFLPKFNKEEITLKIDIIDEKALVYCDRLSIIRILNNLIENALQYGGRENVIGIDLVQLENDYQINIWDKGPGIEEEHIPFIFERLYIRDKARKKPVGSSGLGLSIAKKLIEKHDGKIWVESKLSEKTVFSFTIPKL